MKSRIFRNVPLLSLMRVYWRFGRNQFLNIWGTAVWLCPGYSSLTMFGVQQSISGVEGSEYVRGPAVWLCPGYSSLCPV